MKRPNFEDAKRRQKQEIDIVENSYNLDEKQKVIGNNKNYFIKTYGCQMNEHDTEKIKAILEDMGYKEVELMDEADLILLNTCAIRENAHNKVFGMIGRIKHLKETKPHIVAGICGCMAQEESVVDEIMSKYKWLDLVFGTHNIHHLPNLLTSTLAKKEIEIEVFSKEGEVYENIPIKRESKHKALINIIYGCDKFCTYCIVPYTRGMQRSRTKEYIIGEANNLVKDGYKEITLLGQNVNAYGKDLYDNYEMADLLSDIAKTGMERIRFITSHPWDFTDRMIEVIKNNSNVMPYVHLPIQSGSSEILKRMGRRYTKEDYIKLYLKLKENVPNITISTDIIVGFPGETEDDFNETLEVVDLLQFDSAFTFIFSKRVGTPAAKMEDTVTLDEKNKRLQILNEKVNYYTNISNQKMLDSEVKVLIEGQSEKNSDILFGFTETGKKVNIKTNEDLIGKIILVKIVKAKTWHLDGEIISVN